MRDDLVQKLYTDYPSIFINKNEDGGIVECELSVEDGWYNIIDKMCFLITQNEKAKTKWLEYRKSKGEEIHESEYDVPVKAIQVKEKFGGLRFYVYGGNEYARGIIAMGESISSQVCEECGEKGSPTQDGWIRTLCENHKTERRWRTENESKTILSDSR